MAEVQPLQAGSIPRSSRSIIRTRSSAFAWLQAILDGVLMFAVLLIHAMAKTGDFDSRYRVLAVVATTLMWTIYHGTGVYSQTTTVREHAWRRFKAWGLVIASLVLLAFVTKTSSEYSREVILVWATAGFLIQLLTHLNFQRWVHRRNVKDSVSALVVGANALGQRVAERVNQDAYRGERVVGFVDDGSPSLRTGNLPLKGTTAELGALVATHNVRRVYIALRLHEMETVKQITQELADENVDVIWAPDIFDMPILNHRIGDINGIPLIALTETPLSAGAAIVKRVEDLVLSSLILLTTFPVMLAIAVGVKLSSPGPVLYRQRRVSWNGKTFDMLKFRTMPIDAESEGAIWGHAHAKNPTRLGSFLRHSSLDELPQFVNVLKGEMSIVGPRPERDVFVQQFRHEIPRYMQKHMVRAGITGWAQVNGWRGDTDLRKRIEYDLSYIQNWSLWLDLRLILLTLVKCLTDHE